MNSSYVVIFKIIIIIFIGCSRNFINHQKHSDSTTVDNYSKIAEEQPVYPVNTDDPFFFKEALEEEAFRVLITKDSYQIRQISFLSEIEKIKDLQGDEIQLKYYREYYEMMNFKDWEFEGVMKIRLNPQTANIEKIHYYQNYIPRVKQALELFLQDVSRYKFRYLTDKMTPDTFLIRVLWRIEKDPNITEEEAKYRAIEFLKTRIK